MTTLAAEQAAREGLAAALAEEAPTGRRTRFVGPNLRDPRLHVACALVTVQIVGQVALDFELSIPQILVALLTCAAIEIVATWRRDRLVAWPASALLTGNGIALLLRVEGTEHGDWWSTRGLWIFASVATFGLLSKYTIRIDGRPLFNPSNLALVACFLILGTDTVNPLDFWWGEPSAGLAVAYVVIVGAGIVITLRGRLVPIALTFWVVFATGLAIVALAGHCMTARWHVGPVCDATFWRTTVMSPEILIFALFMITDPRTAPLGRRPRLAYAALIGFVAAVLVAAQRTEFAAKVAVLSALVIVCALRPLLERRLGDAVPATASLRRPARGPIFACAAIATLVLLAAGIPARPDAAASQGRSSHPTGRDEAAVVDLTIPPVERDASVDTITGGVSRQEAQRMGREVARHLASRDDGGVSQVDAMTVRVIRRPVPQSPPRIAVHVSGHVTLDGRVAPLDALFVVTRQGDSYVVEAELPS